MMRISNHTIKSHLIDNIQSHTQKIDQKNQQLTTGKKNLRVSDSPIEAINSIYSRVRLNQIAQYRTNILDSKDHINLSHDKVSHSNAMLHRIREIAVQSSNGTYNQDDRKHMAFEVEELLRELIRTGNTTFDDKYIYSGSEHKKKPFVITETEMHDMGRSLVEAVTYTGDYRHTPREISKEEWVKVHTPGNEVFWGEPHIVVSLSDAQNYVTQADQVIRLDGHEISIAAGDNLDSIVQTINREASTVRAFKQELENGNVVLGLESTYPHQIALEDLKNGTVLQDLGIVRPGVMSRFPGQNIASNTLESGGSIFDSIIRFRNNLINNRTESIGTMDLKSLTEGMNGLLASQSRISSLQGRLTALEEAYRLEEVNVTERLSHNEDMDLAKASIELNQIQNMHRISLMTASKYINPTLMDYLE